MRGELPTSPSSSQPASSLQLTEDCHSASEMSLDLFQLGTRHCLTLPGDLEHVSVHLTIGDAQADHLRGWKFP